MISLRFDDCKISQYDIGYNLLKKNDLKAVMFPIGKRTGHRDYIKMGQLLEMQSNGIEIGYHTYSHIDISTLSEQELELETNPNEFKQAGLNIKSFAIPFSKGSDDNQLVQTLTNKMKYENICGIPNNKATKIGVKPLIFSNYNIDYRTDLKELENMLNNIIENKLFLVISFHKITKSIDEIQPNDITSIDLNKFINVIDLISKKKQEEGLIDVTFQEYNIICKDFNKD